MICVLFCVLELFSAWLMNAGMSYEDKSRGVWYASRRQGKKVERVACKTEVEANLVEANWKAGNECKTLSKAEESDALAALAILKKHGLSKTLTESALFFVNHGEHLKKAEV